MKIGLVGAELCYADGRTDGRTVGMTGRHDETNNSQSQFCEHA